MNAAAKTALQRLREATHELYANFVDPLERYYDDGEDWLPLTAGGSFAATTIFDETTLAETRRQCREIAATNEFALNGHENRISFVVGPGHNYQATPALTAHRGQADTTDHERGRGLAADAQREIDEFVRVNRWHRRQQEIVYRRDRDGEAFLRFFAAADGTLRVRFVEPDQVATPPARATDPAARLGILTEPHDVETVLGYWIDGQLIDAAEIQHRKANVDSNVRRGLPLFYPVRKNLRRAEKLLRNMSVVAEIQSAIALIRKHQHGTRSALDSFATGEADESTHNTLTGRTTYYRHYGPGTIIDAYAGVDYDFPANALDASAYVAVLQAELRAIAARLVMPEFMLTSDASNSSYSSTLIAEGPAMRMFGRMQAEQIDDDLEVMRRVIDHAAAAGRLPPNTLELVTIHARPPSLAIRDQLAEAQRFRIEHESGVLSPQTWSQKTGLDYEEEQRNFRDHQPIQPPADSRPGAPPDRTIPRTNLKPDPAR